MLTLIYFTHPAYICITISARELSAYSYTTFFAIAMIVPSICWIELPFCHILKTCLVLWKCLELFNCGHHSLAICCLSICSLIYRAWPSWKSVYWVVCQWRGREWLTVRRGFSGELTLELSCKDEDQAEKGSEDEPGTAFSVERGLQPG